MSRPGESADDRIGMSCPITRRDFVGGVLVGCGALTTLGCRRDPEPDTASNAPSGSEWTGYGGVGDYSWSNGNTEAVMKAAHGIRDRLYPDVSGRPVDANHDLVIVGGGFSGTTVAYEFSKRRGKSQSCLLLENHPVMGGEAKQNEFIVDGRRLTAPQGSNGGLLINDGYVKGSFDGGRYDVYADTYRELDMPSSYELEPLAGGAERYNLPNYHYAPMGLTYESLFEAGYFFPGHGWAKNPLRARFENTPWPASVQKEMDDFVNNRRDVLSGIADADAWLDSMTYYDLLDKLGYGDEVRRYIDPYIAVANFGVCGNAISAYAAKRLRLPGAVPGGDGQVAARDEKTDQSGSTLDSGVVSFPGGNAAILRRMLARTIPGSVTGDSSVAATTSSPLDFDALDRPGAPIRIRLGSTVIDVRHDGPPGKADHVIVTYVRNGDIRKVRARSVVMATGGWVNRNIVSDLPATFVDAYRQFHYGPILTANVAVRNWRFFDKLGLTVARWFEGIGWHVCVRRNVVFGNATPLTPDDPIVLTFYIPFLSPGLPAAAQGPAGRERLLSTSYADFERQIRLQMSAMFATAGFDVRRDIAGIILNRWGHAYCAPPPGFFLGHSGNPPPCDVLREPHGRIVFAHSELQQGLMNMAFGMLEAHRAAIQVMEML